MPHLVLVRHGNTFESDQTPTFVGGKTDMPLTSKGEEQAQTIAQMLADHYMPLSCLVCGPLQRTRRFAEIISAITGKSFLIDDRLCEIDYGLWENKSSADVRASYGDVLVDGWEQDGVWPDNMGWSPSRQTLADNVAAHMAEQHRRLLLPDESTHVIVTSNGILRFVYSHITGSPADKNAKVGTGCYCLLEPTPEGWTIKAWNQKVS